MQLRLDAADRLVELVEERRGPVYAEEAARRLFKLRHVPAGMARSLLDEAVTADARLAWSADSVRLRTRPGPALPPGPAPYVAAAPGPPAPAPGVCRTCRTGPARHRGPSSAAPFRTRSA